MFWLGPQVQVEHCTSLESWIQMFNFDDKTQVEQL